MDVGKDSDNNENLTDNRPVQQALGVGRFKYSIKTWNYILRSLMSVPAFVVVVLVFLWFPLGLDIFSNPLFNYSFAILFFLVMVQRVVLITASIIPGLFLDEDEDEERWRKRFEFIGKWFGVVSGLLMLLLIIWVVINSPLP